MKRLIIVFGLLWFACPLNASLDSLEKYTSFVIKKEMWVCSSIVFPVDISYDAFNVDFKTIAQGGYGYFIQVKPGTHTDGSYLPDAEDIIESHVKGVLNVIGKPAGVYEYVFVSNDDGFCGMSKDEQSVVRIYIVPQPVGFPVLTNVCPGTTEEVDFNKFIPAEIKYFIDAMGWTITYTLDGKEVSMPVTAGLSNVGNTEYRYTINDSDGPFKGKYSEMQDSIYQCPQDSAYLMHTVRIREDEEYAIPDRSISFCTDVLMLVSETKVALNTNLFSYLGSSVPNGKWSIEYDAGLATGADDNFWVDETSGDAIVPTGMISVLGIDSIIFKYSYKDCMANDTFTLLTFNFNKATFENTFVDQERDVCRNLMSGVVELSSIFGFTVPLTSGMWFQTDENNVETEMLYGAVDISAMKSGSLYTFRYNVSPVIDNLCLAEGSSTVFQLRIHDLEVDNAEVKICKQQFANGVTIDLSRYVAGLNDGERIPSDRVTWKDPSGNKIDNPGSYTLRADEEWQTADTSAYRMLYQYEVSSDCGPYTGNLYISAIDSMGVDTLRKIVVCYTDDYAKHIDLFQVLGIVGANGRFELYDDPVNNNGAKIDSPVMKQPNIMNAFASYDTANESEIYTFKYIPNANDACVRDNMQITIVVTKNIEAGSEFE
ncbi:MAG: hypothetical protein LBG80_15805 [Bacteroidales bacterium]|jgi:hypothetical protein|nr:hypothetical protein [Bacteroidales bacterium]